MSDFDHPYKRLFSHQKMMADFIRGFLNSELTEICDLKTLERCNGSYVTDDLREREDDLRLSVHHLIEVRNLAACLFGLEQSSGSKELNELGAKLNEWMETEPTLQSMRRDFSLFFENSLKRDEDIPIPNPFRGGTMLAERVNRWIAEYKAEGKAEGKVEGMATILYRMKQTGMSIADIAKVTGLSEDEIKHMI